jgi:predicted Zn-dependent protease
MKLRGIVSVILMLCLCACSKVPITQRKQTHLLPESQMISMSLTEYHDFLQQHPPVLNGSEEQMVKNVGAKIQSAVTNYMSSNGYGDRLKGYKWEFNLVNSSEVNAWCMPGGKVVVYSGILPYTLDETGLAIVMGHEIGHAVAQHGNERLSQQLIAQGVGLGLDYYLSTKPAETHQLFMQAFGIGAQVGVLLPFSRLQESEADKLGLVFAALAGYDPGQAVPFWQRMSKVGGSKPPEFLSTHPSDERRIKDIQDYLPKAMKYYNKRPI